jgi:predicted RNase H-like nuclease
VWPPFQTAASRPTQGEVVLLKRECLVLRSARRASQSMSNTQNAETPPYHNRVTDMLPSRGSVLGIDVGYSTMRRSSAVCRLDWTCTEVTWAIDRFRATEPERSKTISRIAGDGPISVAAFDGPLRSGLNEIGRYRLAERMLTMRFKDQIGKPGQSSAPVGKQLNASANHCARIVLNHAAVGAADHGVRIHEKAIVEAFPSAFLGVMLSEPAAHKVSRSSRSDSYFEHLARSGRLRALVGHCLPGRQLKQEPDLVTNHDDRAALVCALTALCVLVSDFVAVGDEDGWIILPARSFIEPWAMTALKANADDCGVCALQIEEPRHTGHSAPVTLDG